MKTPIETATSVHHLPAIGSLLGRERSCSTVAPMRDIVKLLMINYLTIVQAD